MKIAFDLRWIRSEKIDGISRYTLNLVSHLLQQDRENEYLCIGHQPLLEQHLPLSTYPQARIVSIPQQVLSLKDFLQTQRSIERLDVDLFHVPNYLSSPFCGTYVKILTVYDLIPFLFPDALSKSRLLWRCFYKTPYPARHILRSADIIVTTSEHTKRDLVRLLNIPPDRIQVVWSGIETRFHPGYSIPESFWERYGLERNYLLYVGRQDPYKGLNFLVEAFARLPQEFQHNFQVVIAGKTDPRYIGDVHALLDRHQLHDAFRFLDYVPDGDLPFLYSAARLLVHPSLYEGFGLPPLESMACGTPVVYADTSSLSELIGEAGLAVLPASAEALSEGIRCLLEREDLRQQYRKRGLQHSRRYSWERVAAEMLNIYAQSRKF
ncbi:MAG: glycosyltransferase family 4 protein [bacterium]|nr:glycosyltransferase family 4 protein [bacterium]